MAFLHVHRDSIWASCYNPSPCKLGCLIKSNYLKFVLCAAQVWDVVSGRLRKDLQFQADEQFMMHDTAVIALAVSRDSELLASGSQDGKIKVCRGRPATETLRYVNISGWSEMPRSSISSPGSSPKAVPPIVTAG